MKTKSIKKYLKTELNNWINSITDDILKEKVKEDLIVTGGCIASMLLKQEVNDIDIYFKTKSTVKAISEYYIKQVNKIYTNKISDSKIEVIDGNNMEVKDYEAHFSKNEDGNKWKLFKKSMTPDRIKIYIPHIGYWRRSDEELIPFIDKNIYEVVYLSENAISISNNIQLVIRFYGEPEEIHKNYDFVHATNWYTLNDNHLELRSIALESLLTKELKYIGSKYPLTSAIRVKKFTGRGFTINAGEMLKILWQVSELNLKDPSTLMEQLIGVDIAYFSELISVLTNVNPEKMTYSYINTIIDRIFQDTDDDIINENK